MSDSAISVGLSPQAKPAVPVGWGLGVLCFLVLQGLSLLSVAPHAGALWLDWASPLGVLLLLDARSLAQAARRWLVLAALMAGPQVVLWMQGSVGSGGVPMMLLMRVALGTLGIALGAWMLRARPPQSLDLNSPQALARLWWQASVFPALLLAAPLLLVAAMVDQMGLARQVLAVLMGQWIGAAALWPLLLLVWVKGWQPLRRGMRMPWAPPLLLLSMAVTLLVASVLTHSYVVMVVPLVLLASQCTFAVTALATLLQSILMALLLRQDMLLVPPTSVWWGDAGYFLSLLATLLPAPVLSAAMQGQRVVLRELAQSEERFRKLYTTTPAMMHASVVRAGLPGPIVGVSQRWLEVMGYREDEVLGRNFLDFVAPKSQSIARGRVVEQLRQCGRCDDIEAQVVNREGRVLDVLYSAVLETDAQNHPVRVYVVLQDVTERNRLAERSHYAEHDVLTGLPNRVLLQDRLERAVAHHQRHGGAFALGYLDLDHFKNVNDRWGHDAGDFLLRAVSERLLGSLRATDTVCRVGGDEFVLLIMQADELAVLLTVCEKLLLQVGQPLTLEEEDGRPTVQVQASLGLALFPQHGSDPAALMQHADQAMYWAKHAGRNRCVVYDAAMRQQTSGEG